MVNFKEFQSTPCQKNYNVLIITNVTPLGHFQNLFHLNFSWIQLLQTYSGEALKRVGCKGGVCRNSATSPDPHAVLVRWPYHCIWTRCNSTCMCDKYKQIPGFQHICTTCASRFMPGSDAVISTNRVVFAKLMHHTYFNVPVIIFDFGV